MNNYMFETCTGQFNWNKLMRKSVHLVGYFLVCYLMSHVITLNVTAWRCMAPDSNSLPATQTRKSPFRTSSEFVYPVILRLCYVQKNVSGPNYVLMPKQKPLEHLGKNKQFIPNSVTKFSSGTEGIMKISSCNKWCADWGLKYDTSRIRCEYESTCTLPLSYMIS